MNEQRQKHMLENSTKLFSSITSSADHTRTVINVIYVLGIIFMLIVFLVLLWINLYSQRCWCWHDTPLIHRFNRQWLTKRSMKRTLAVSSSSSSNNQRQRRSPAGDDDDDELHS